MFKQIAAYKDSDRQTGLFDVQKKLLSHICHKLLSFEINKLQVSFHFQIWLLKDFCYYVPILFVQ